MISKYYLTRSGLTVVTIALGFFSTLAPLSAAQFQDVTSILGVQVDTGAYGNPIWADIDNDGNLDLIVPTRSTQPLIYLNKINRFKALNANRSGIVNPAGASTDWRGFAVGDYDGDGDLDLFIAATSGLSSTGQSNLLFQCDGPAHFHYVSDPSLAAQRKATAGFFFDYDRDGTLELFVKNYFADGSSDGNFLYRYNGGTSFTDIAAPADLDCPTIFSNQCGHGDNCSFQDIDNDGDMDVVFCHDRPQLWTSDGVVYTQQPEAVIPSSPKQRKGVAWGDYNNDGFPDLFIARGAPQSNMTWGTQLYHNNHGVFSATDEVAASVGVYTGAITYAGVWGDYDNDGYLDLFVTVAGGAGDPLGTNNKNLLFHNNGPDLNGNYSFTNVAAGEPLELGDGVSLHHGAAWADYNNDGFLDLVVKDGIGDTPDFQKLGKVHLFKNLGVLGANNHFLKVNLQGGTQTPHSNARGIGARVTVTYGTPSKIAYRQNNGGGGGELESQGSQPLHFGIGSATSATVRVEWPSGVCDSVLVNPVNQTVTIVEGSSSGCE
jgi:ASPIC and UnbV/FG-GAP-like repeat